MKNLKIHKIHTDTPINMMGPITYPYVDGWGDVWITKNCYLTPDTLLNDLANKDEVELFHKTKLADKIKKFC